MSGLRGLPQAPPGLWHRDDMRAALLARDMGLVLRLFRRHTGSSQTQVGMALGIPQPHVSDIERGHRRVLTLEMIERFAAGLSIPRHLLGLAAELPADAEPTFRQAREQLLPDHPMDRSPTATDRRPEPMAPPGLRPSDREAYDIMEMVRRTERSDVGAGTLDSLYAVVDRLCRDYPTVPASVLLPQTKPRLQYVLRLLDGRVRLEQHRELLVVAGWLSVLLGCLHYDLGNVGAASAARDAAYHFGKEAGHNEIKAWSYELLAWFALTERRFKDVISAARSGREFTDGGWATVQLAVQEAKGWSRLGDTGQARAAMDRGLAELQAREQPEHVEHHFVFDPTKYSFYATSCYQWLGEYDRAQELAEYVLPQCLHDDGSVRWPMRLAETQLTMGIVAARRGELELAVDRGRVALAIERVSGPSLLDRARELDSTLREAFPGERPTTDFHEMYLDARRRHT